MFGSPATADLVCNDMFLLPHVGLHLETWLFAAPWTPTLLFLFTLLPPPLYLFPGHGTHTAIPLPVVTCMKSTTSKSACPNPHQNLPSPPACSPTCPFSVLAPSLTLHSCLLLLQPPHPDRPQILLSLHVKLHKFFHEVFLEFTSFSHSCCALRKREAEARSYASVG